MCWGCLAGSHHESMLAVKLSRAALGAPVLQLGGSYSMPRAEPSLFLQKYSFLKGRWTSAWETDPQRILKDAFCSLPVWSALAANTILN